MDDVFTIDKLLAAKRMLEDISPPDLPKWDGVIRENALLTVTKQRPRSWRERLFTWPWKPWRTMHIWTEPDPSVYKVPYAGLLVGARYQDQREAWFAHPLTAAHIRQQLHTGGSE